jgi:NADH-quinone oxidoreductase subunit E
VCNNVLTEAMYKELEDFIANLGDTHGQLITILHKAQNIFGYLPYEVQLFVSRKLNMPAAKVNGVVTFYSYFTEKPRGKNIISVCMGTACFVRGSAEILSDIEDRLHIKAGETSEDGKYSIDALRCVGACGLAPVVMVNGKVHGRVNRKDVAKILESAEQ